MFAAIGFLTCLLIAVTLLIYRGFARLLGLALLMWLVAVGLPHLLALFSNIWAEFLQMNASIDAVLPQWFLPIGIAINFSLLCLLARLYRLQRDDYRAELELVEQQRHASEVRCQLLEIELSRLRREMRELQFSTPTICHSCGYFCGLKTQQGILVCALHPTGNGSHCVDFEPSHPDSTQSLDESPVTVAVSGTECGD